MREYPVVFGGQSPLVGIVTEPDTTVTGAPVCLFLNAGLGHRVGPSRVYVKLARRLAEAGVVSLRFDFSGIGDSPPSPSRADAEERAVSETSQAMDYLGRSLGTSTFVALGLCSGANTAFALARQDPRVTGAVLINATMLPSAHSEQQRSEALRRAQAHHHGDRFVHGRSWLRVLTGRSDFRGLTRSMLLLARRTFGLDRAPRRDVDLGELPELGRRGVELLAVFTDGDIGLELLATHVGRFENLASLPRFELEILRETDHILTSLWAQTDVEEKVLAWMARRFGVPTAPGPRAADARQAVR